MLTRWSDFDRTFAALDDFRRRMDRLFYDYDQLRDDDRWLSSRTGWPAVAVRDEGNQLTVYAEVPGLSDKDINLNLNQNVLSIAGQRSAEVPEGFTAHRQERGSYEFSRSLSLPCAVDPERAKAVVKDGILTVTLEKAQEAKPRQITVKAR
ncbi:MAG: Hsp20/alpha crystallin family protein [Deltaproteobacteria bacterium]|nr:Hsp20/alpha crystallin family protein [Deltaproteobacteria bacterium]